VAFATLFDGDGRAHIICSKVFVLKPFSEKCNFMRWIDDCKCILRHVKEEDSLPMRKVYPGIFSTPWIDRFCLITSLLLAYFISLSLSDYVEDYLGDNSDLICLSFLIIMAPFVGDFFSRSISNYIHK
jgi:hypothetical protein